ncbi:MAG: putative oxidoreductase [Chloroflexi bacterium OLB13]|nr:MAG: putative oxidoreductase [Chloroflexi bacterium OLB13]
MKTAIIGAGVAGLAAAWDLANAGHDVVVFEAADRVGGLASGFKDESWAWSLEKFYHHWFQTDADLLRFARELGLDGKIMFPRPKTSYWLDGKIYRSEMNLSTLQLPLSWLGLIRLGLAGVFLKLTPWWQPLENTTADSWLRRWMGDEVYSKLWRPLLIGKFADRYRDVNMAWMWARIKARSVKLGTYQGGFQSFMDDVADAVRRAGVDIRLSSPVTSLTREAAGWKLVAADIEITVDHVLSTSSPTGLLKQAPALADTSYGRAVASLDSIGAICVVYALKHSVLTDGTYWLNLPAQSADKAQNPFPFLAMVEHTNWLPSANYGGDVLVYCGDYADPNHEYFTLSDEAMIDRFSQAFKTVNPDFEPGWIRKAWVWRAPYAQPVPRVGHSARIPDLATPLPGLWWASMSQVYPWDRGTNYAVEIGRRAAARMIAEAQP